MPAQGLDEVFRARWLEATSAPGAAHRLQSGGQHALVNTDQKNEQRNHERGGKIESRRASCNHSALNSSKAAPAAADLAITTIRLPGGKSDRVRRISSRRRRRTRFRTTAPPTRLDVIIPALESPSQAGRKKPIFRRRPCATFPLSRTCAKSRPSRSRADFGNVLRSGLGVSGVVDFDTLWQETLASTLAAAVQDIAARLGFHARAEAKLTLARALGRLVSAFHRIGSVERSKVVNERQPSILFFFQVRKRV